MASTIGRAGKHVFSTLEHSNSNKEVPRRPDLPPPDYPQSNSSSTKINNPVPGPKRRDSTDIDLEQTLKECITLDAAEALSPKVSPKVSSSDSMYRPSFTSPTTASSPRSSKLEANGTKELAEKTLALSGMDGNKKVADLEKEELLAALEVLKMQNQMLSNRIEKNQQESRLQVEYEKQQRIMAITTLERENKDLLQKLITDKREAEQKLDEEKSLFTSTLRQIESEKLNLEQRIQSIESQSAAEVAQLADQKAAMENQILKLELDKELMYGQVLQLEAMNDYNSPSELELMRYNVQQIELEKQNLQLQLQYNNQLITENNNKLNERVQEEKIAAQERLCAIEQQKQEAGSRVALAESTALQQADAVQLQMLKQQHHQLATSAATTPTATTRSKTAVSISVPDSASPEPSIPSNDFKASVGSTKSGKAEAKLKAKALADKLKQRKQQRLTSSITKMRANLEQEKQLKSQQSSNNNSNNSIAASAAGDALVPTTKRVLPARRSLFDLTSLSTAVENHAAESNDGVDRYDMLSTLPARSLIADSTPATGAQHGTLSKASSRTATDKDHNVAPRKTIMDLDSSDDEDDQLGNLKPKAALSTKSPTAVPEVASSSSKSVSSDLPSAHAAAANGDLNTLKQLIQGDPSLLDSLDVSNRYVVFYAAAHGHFSIIIYLLQLYSNNISSIFSVDSFGDSILHAAVCSGNAVCLELLLDKLEKVYPITEEKLQVLNHKNSYGLAAAHMANDTSCLELLFKHGGNMSIVDAQHRTPLFICCLLNNDACVHFLMNCIYSNDFMYKADYRGDTPLHAAACNGSIDCLLTLLQHGYDPRMLNAQSLKAVDLAIRNKHHKCREILAEYLLHYCTSSEFDSVLFLATLEGHRYIAQNVHKIPNASAEATSSPQRLLNKEHLYPSMFTLRDAKTMRLQKFGNWLAYHDPYTLQVFWYNHESCSGQWELPEAVLQYQQQQQQKLADSLKVGHVENEEDRFDKALQAKMSMRMKRRGDWIEYSSDGSHTIYYNDKDGSFTWDDPFGHLPQNQQQPAGYDQAEYNSNMFAGGDWQPYIDASNGSVYWYNHVSQESQWDNPYGEGYDSSLVLQQAMLNGQTKAYDDEQHHEVETVYDLHQLGV